MVSLIEIRASFVGVNLCWRLDHLYRSKSSTEIRASPQKLEHLYQNKWIVSEEIEASFNRNVR